MRKIVPWICPVAPLITSRKRRKRAAVSEGFKTVDPKVDGRKLTLDWEASYYHTPKDDMNQPNLNFEAAAKCTRVIAAVGYELSQQTERPHWNQGDFFTRFVKAQSMTVDR